MSRPRREEDMGDLSSQEAIEEEERIQEDNSEQIFEESGDDLMQNLSKDYQIIDELDHYQDEGVDNQEISYDLQAIHNANQEINRRHRLMNINEDKDEIEDLMEEESDLEKHMHRRNIQEYQYQDDNSEEAFDERRYLDAEECKGKITQWIKQAETIKFIHSKFTKFLTKYKRSEENYAYYALKIRDMVINNHQSFEVQYDDIKQLSSTIALWLGLNPGLILPEFNIVAYQVAIKNFPAYKKMHPQVFVKITKMPFIDNLRDLRHCHLGKLVQVKGVITVRSEKLNQLKKVTYKCVRCGELKGPFYLNERTEISFGKCTSCQGNGPYFIEQQKSIFRNYQKMTIQETPSEVLAGRIPRTKEIIVYGENVDAVRPGDEVMLVGIYDKLQDNFANAKQGFPIFSTFIEVVYISDNDHSQVSQFDEYKAEEYKKLSKDENLSEKIYGSIAPSIYGYRQVKRALTLAMFGGQPVQGTHRVRGDINILLLGDPGIAKSQFLKSLQKVFHRTIYTTGKGASAVGLTASVKRDLMSRQWKLEAGALVLADKGMCLIDQFDKMNEYDRTSIHEAMQQQSISISKAGIVTSLRARCSVVAAANPNKGRYDSKLNFSDNVDLSEPILSRFDIIQVMKDEVNEELDNNLATFVINSHMKNHIYNKKYEIPNQFFLEEDKNQRLPYINIQFLRGYIKYARQKFHPSIPPKNNDIIKEFFKRLRKASLDYGGMRVSIRQAESIIRISVAHAKMHLRTQVQKQDVYMGIKVMMQSFIQTQKVSTALKLRKQFKRQLQ